MNKVIFLSILFYIFSFSLNAQNSAILDKMKLYQRPQYQQLKYSVEGERIVIDSCYGRISISKYKEGLEQNIDIIKAKQIEQKKLKYIIDTRYIENIYLITIDLDREPEILLVSYLYGSSGLSANMTFGLLVNMHNASIQYLSTWGNVASNFYDVDNSRDFEFLCMDLEMLNGEYVLIPNIFKLDNQNLYSINLSKQEKEINIIPLLKSDKICMVNPIDDGIILLDIPDIMDEQKFKKDCSEYFNEN